jgi:hypothetical protein
VDRRQGGPPISPRNQFRSPASTAPHHLRSRWVVSINGRGDSVRRYEKGGRPSSRLVALSQSDLLDSYPGLLVFLARSCIAYARLHPSATVYLARAFSRTAAFSLHRPHSVDQPCIVYQKLWKRQTLPYMTTTLAWMIPLAL